MSNAAIYFHPEGYETARSDLKGRHVAGESFLIGFFRHSGLDRFACHVDQPEMARLFADLAARHEDYGRKVHAVEPPHERHARDENRKERDEDDSERRFEYVLIDERLGDHV